MFRRIPQIVARNNSLQARSYFYAGGGETGIWGKTMQATVRNITWATAISIVIVFKLVFINYSTHNQFVSESTDLWEDDGTKLEGEEAVANLKIYRERIMPFMDSMQEKIDA